jgi:hypothetical protein
MRRTAANVRQSFVRAPTNGDRRRGPTRPVDAGQEGRTPDHRRRRDLRIRSVSTSELAR